MEPGLKKMAYGLPIETTRNTSLKPKVLFWQSVIAQMADCMIKSLGYEVHQIGDCVEPRNAQSAIYEGTVLGRLI